MPSNFDLAFDYLMDQNIEGGYTNLPGDPGGETKFGISKRSYPQLDIQSLTIEEAKQIYRTDWWDNSYENMPSIIATKIFIIAINTGAHKAYEIVQEALNSLGVSLKVDGMLGVVTVSAINRTEPERLRDRIIIHALKHYLELADKRADMNLPCTFRSWVRRVLV